MEWQPIETAPKELEHIGDFILVSEPWKHGKNGGYVSAAFWGKDEQAWLSATNHDGYEHSVLTPTHWMPLPDPPISHPAEQ